MTEQQRTEGWKRIGKHMGYPQCCIDDFCKLEFPRPFRKLCGTGYIPCGECDKKSEKELVNTINANRQAPHPFPSEIDDGIDEIWSQYWSELKGEQDA